MSEFPQIEKINCFPTGLRSGSGWHLWIENIHRIFNNNAL